MLTMTCSAWIAWSLSRFPGPVIRQKPLMTAISEIIFLRFGTKPQASCFIPAGSALFTPSGRPPTKRRPCAALSLNRFPAPSAPVKVVLKARKEGAFVDVWITHIDPKDIFIDNAHPRSPGPLLTLQKMGEPEKKVDLLIMGDGYTAAERSKFEKDARRFTEILFSTSPFKEHRQDFNVW